MPTMPFLKESVNSTRHVQYDLLLKFNKQVSEFYNLVFTSPVQRKLNIHSTIPQ